MGTTAHLLVIEQSLGSAERLLDDAQAEVAELEQRWSRFLPTSELSRLNAHPGAPVMVSDDTFDVIALAVEAWRFTHGRFDPTVLDALVDAGYDRTFDDLPAVDADGPHRLATLTKARPAPGCAGVELDPTLRAVTLPPGVSLDLGGVGKGRAADLLALHLVDHGADGACVNLGGDVRAVGSGPDGGPWVIGVEHPLDPSVDIATVALAQGAVTTSSRANRKWVTADGEAHHLIDPSTGRPACPGLISVTVLAAEAAWAEILAKAAFVAGPEDGPALVADADAAGLFVHDDGTVTRAGGFERFES